MPSSPVIKIVEQLRKTVLRREEDTLSDGQLVDRFLKKRDEMAFAALVRRHGPMVWGVCRRIVGHAHDAEDAFQAAFLILVRKAAAVKQPETIGNWLYGVACHAALKARTTSSRVRAKEKQVTSMPEPAQDSLDDREELQRLLDQELSALPDKYRLPVVLCDLESRTRREVAAQLKIPQGTLSSRLATAHQMLAKRLARYGLAVSGGSLAALLAQNAVSACMPASVVASTIKTAMLVAASDGAVAGVVVTNVAVLTEGVMKAMLLTKLKAVVAIVLMLGFVITGATGLAYRTAAAQGDQARNAEEQPATPQKQEHRRGKEAFTASDKDIDELQGEWEVVAMEVGEDGQASTDNWKGMKWMIKGNEVTVIAKGPTRKFSFTLDPAKSPKQIDITRLQGPLQADKMAGIYAIEGRRLRMCLAEKGRPKEFATGPGDGRTMITLEKAAITAWGKEVGGLQAGLGYHPGEKQTYSHGEAVKLVVRVRNVAKEEVKFRYVRQFFIENPPAVTDGEGKPVALPHTRTFGFHALVDVKLAPEQEIELAELKLELRPASASGDRGYRTLYGTGKFQIQYEQLSHPDNDKTLDKLATGKLELEVIDLVDDVRIEKAKKFIGRSQGIDKPVPPDSRVAKQAAPLQGRGPIRAPKDPLGLTVHAEVFPADAGRLRVGQAAIILVDAFPRDRYRGKIHKIQKVSLSDKGTVTVVVEITDAGARLAPDMTAVVQFLFAEEQKDEEKQSSGASRNAEDLLDTALKLAKTGKKRVLLIAYTPFCAVCRQLDGFLEEVMPVVDKHLIVARLNLENAGDLQQLFRKRGIGDAPTFTPWMAMLDESGRVVAKSGKLQGPDSVTGLPQGSEADRKYFNGMLRTACPNITDAELARIDQAAKALHDRIRSKAASGGDLEKER